MSSTLMIGMRVGAAGAAVGAEAAVGAGAAASVGLAGWVGAAACGGFGDAAGTSLAVARQATSHTTTSVSRKARITSGRAAYAALASSEVHDEQHGQERHSRRTYRRHPRQGGQGRHGRGRIDWLGGRQLAR